VDPFARKDWYDIKAPSMFTNRQVGKTLVTRTTGIKIASEGLKGRVIEACLADLNQARARTHIRGIFALRPRTLGRLRRCTPVDGLLTSSRACSAGRGPGVP
jgi:hypothetical protein